MQADDRGFADVLTLTFPTAKAFEAERKRTANALTELLERAKATGRLRDDFAHQDVPLILMANAGVVTATRDAAPDAWRRLLGYLIQSFATEAAKPLPDPPTHRQIYRALTRRHGGPGRPVPLITLTRSSPDRCGSVGNPATGPPGLRRRTARSETATPTATTSPPEGLSDRSIGPVNTPDGHDEQVAHLVRCPGTGPSNWGSRTGVAATPTKSALPRRPSDKAWRKHLDVLPEGWDHRTSAVEPRVAVHGRWSLVGDVAASRGLPSSAEPYSGRGGKHLGRRSREGHDLGRTAPEDRLRRHL